MSETIFSASYYENGVFNEAQLRTDLEKSNLTLPKQLKMTKEEIEQVIQLEKKSTELGF